MLMPRRLTYAIAKTSPRFLGTSPPRCNDERHNEWRSDDHDHRYDNHNHCHDNHDHHDAQETLKARQL
jgi:hypothetical protein